MEWTTALDNYCERTDASIWSEPVNFLSNFAFILAALFLWRLLQRIPTGQRRPGSSWLVALIFLIGLGSATFHSVATYWAMWADVIPIALFLLFYLWCFFRRDAGLSPVQAWVGLSAFGLVTTVAALVADKTLTNGSQQYFGAWIFLFGITWFHWGRSRSPNSWQLPLATILFAASLYLRTVDMSLCEQWALGTHFGWHTLNGAVLYLVTHKYLSDRRDPLL